MATHTHTLPVRKPSLRRSAITAAAIAAAAVVVTPSAAQAEEAVAEDDIQTVHEVAPGDFLSDLADEHGLDSWRPLWDANPSLDSPDVIVPGQELVVPEADADLDARPLPSDAPAEGPETEEATAEDPAPQQAAEPEQEQTQPEPATTGNGVWDQLAQCESGGNWHINTGNGFYGGLQFTLESWQAVGGTGYPHEASRAEQINRAEQLLAIQGWGAWPSCASQLGLR